MVIFQLLEQALMRYPANLGAERWNKIAETVASRTKEECVARFKACDSHVTVVESLKRTLQIGLKELDWSPCVGSFELQ